MPTFIPGRAGQFLVKTVKPLAETQLAIPDGFFVGAEGKAFPPGTPLGEIGGVLPQQGTPKKTLLFVNGVWTQSEKQLSQMQGLADAMQARVIGIRNATSGRMSDLARVMWEKLSRRAAPAAGTLADSMEASLRDLGPALQDVHVAGHSKGALIVSMALYELERRLRKEVGNAQAEKLLSFVRVTTFGGAAMRYPNGPSYVHLQNMLDPIPMVGLGRSKLSGLLSHPGKDAEVHKFEDRFAKNPHALSCYLNEYNKQFGGEGS